MMVSSILEQRYKMQEIDKMVINSNQQRYDEMR
jgi:hypothetical protein